MSFAVVLSPVGIIAWLLIGLIGSFLGGLILSFFNEGTVGLWGSIVVSVFGACVPIFLVRAISGRQAALRL